MGRTRYSGPVKSTGGFEIGAVGTNTTIIDSSGNLYQAGTVINSTAAEIDRVADKSASVVAANDSTLTATLVAHGDRVVIFGKTTGTTVTLPAATGTGAKFTFIVSIASTSNANIIKVANATDIMAGIALGADTDAAGATGYTWPTASDTDTITMNGTATGGRVGDRVEITDFASGKFQVAAFLSQSGASEATPFSATVS